MSHSINNQYSEPETKPRLRLPRPETTGHSKDTQVSEVGCRNFNSGRWCKNVNNGCPYVHNLDHRREALEMQRARQEKLRLEKSRARLQQQYTKETASKSLNLDPNQIRSGSNPSVLITIPQSAPAQPCNVPATVVEHGQGNGNIVQIPKGICKKFVKWYCKRKDQCPYIHDKEARKAHLSQRKTEKRNAKNNLGDSKRILMKENRPQNVPVQKGGSNAVLSSAQDNYLSNISAEKTDSKILVVHNTTPAASATHRDSQSLVLLRTSSRTSCNVSTQVKAVVTYADASKKGIVRIPAPQPPPTTNSPWDPNTLETWAARYLKEGTVTKYLAPFIRRNVLPLDYISTTGERAPRNSKFHYFSILPGEIRNQIWDLVMDGEKLDCRIQWRYDDEHEGNYYNSRFVPRNVVPRLLHVNTEARSMGMSRFELTFATANSDPHSFFNYTKDRLFIQTRSALEFPLISKMLIKHDIDRIERLALPLRDYLCNKQEFCHAIRRFRKLKHLYVIVGDGLEDLKYSEDKRMAQKVQACLRPIWKRYWPRKHTPWVGMEVVSGLKAHWLGIDGLMWA